MSLKATNNVETNKYELEIEISAEDFEAAIEKAYLKARKNIAMPGFRKGKAPRKLIEKEYGEQVFFEDAVNLLYAPVVNGAVEESGLELVTRPEVEVTEISKENGVKLKATCITKPEVEVKDYKGIEVEKVVNPVTDEDINKQLDALREKNVTVETVDDRAAENGDDVVIDFEGFKDDVAFEGGKAEDFTLSLGSGQFIPGFEDQIVGHTPGETFDVTVTFPEDYGNADLSGKEAVFETTLHYIKESVTPELTDDWVKENLSATMNLNNIDELKAFVKSTMLYDNQSSEVYSALHDKVSYTDELPQIALDYYRDVLLYRIYTYAQNYGTTMDTLLASGMMGSSYDNVDAYLKDAHDSIRSITQQALLMQAVAEKMGFRCDTATMNADFGRYYGTTDPTQYVTAYGENYVKMNVLQSDVMQNLIDNVKYE